MRPLFFFLYPSFTFLLLIIFLLHFITHLCFLSSLSLFFPFPTFENSFIQQALLSVYCTLYIKHSAACGTWTWSQSSFYLCIQSFQFSRVSHVQLFVTPVLHCLPEFAQTQVHWVGDAIYLSCPLSPPSPPGLTLSRHQNLFQWVSSSHQVASVLDLVSASVLPMIIQGWFLLGLTGMISLLSKELSRESSP